MRLTDSVSVSVSERRGGDGGLGPERLQPPLLSQVVSFHISHTWFATVASNGRPPRLRWEMHLVVQWLQLSVSRRTKTKKKPYIEPFLSVTMSVSV